MREQIEERIRQLPIYQYGFLETKEIRFAPRLRAQCRETCPYYGTSWSCPPAVGRIERCRVNCLTYPETLVLSTMREVPQNAEDRLIRRRDPEHDEITRQAEDALLDLDIRTMILSSSVCSLCRECTFPKGVCRHPEMMYPCMESNGIVVADLAEQCNMDTYMGEDVRIDFSVIFFRALERNESIVNGNH